MSSARAISFSNESGQTLHGILHLPDQRVHTPLGVLLLSPGQKNRLGPWRCYVQLARRLAASGVPVLRFDFHGLGDSDGSHENGQMLVDFNGFVQTGGLASDVVSATQFFKRECGVTRFVFAGLCGGAATGLRASTRIPGVYGHVLVDLPVTVSSSARQRYLEQNAAEMMRLRPEESAGVLREYLGKVSDPEAWKRLLRGGSDYRLLLASARAAATTRIGKLMAHAPEPLRTALGVDSMDLAMPPTPAPGPDGEVPAGAHEVLNQPTIDSFRLARAQRQKIFFLNSSNYHPMFEAFFAREHLPPASINAGGLGLLVVPDTNHAFTAEHSQRALFETVEEFVRSALADLADPSSTSPSADARRVTSGPQ